MKTAATEKQSTNATADKIKEWKEKHGNVYMLETIGKSCIVFDPLSSFKIMKQLMMARRKSKAAQVDALLANCWLFGDESLKENEAFKLGIEDAVDELFDIPEYDLTPSLSGGDGELEIKIEGLTLSVKKATRGDVTFAEGRNSENKPLTTQEFLLERIAIDKEQLDAMKKNNRVYMSALLAVGEMKDKVFVAVKKL